MFVLGESETPLMRLIHMPMSQQQRPHDLSSVLFPDQVLSAQFLGQSIRDGRKILLFHVQAHQPVFQAFSQVQQRVEAQ